MSLQQRIRLANIERAAEQRAHREERVARLYQHGYRPPAEYSALWDAAMLIPALAGALALLALAIRWTMTT